MKCERAYEFESFRLRISDGSLFRNGELVPVTPKALLILLVLVENHGRVVTHEELVASAWPDTAVEDGNLKVHISALRRVLAGAGGDRQFIETIPRRGYRFAASVREVPEPGKPAGPLWWKRFAPVMAAAGILAVAAFILLQSSHAGQPWAGGVRQLTSEGIVCTECPLLTDGARVYFTRSQGNRHEIAQIPVDGGEAATIPIALPNPTVLGVAANRGELLVSSLARTQDQRTFWIVPLGGGAPQSLGIAGFEAAWSPDGERIAYVRDNEIRFIDRAGAALRSSVTADGLPCKLRWSPDGRNILYSVIERDARRLSLWQVGLTQAEPIRVHVPTGAGLWGEGAQSGAWSADGDYCLYYSFGRTANGQGTTTFWARRESSRQGRAPSSPPVRLYELPNNAGGAMVASSDGKHLFVNTRHQGFEPARYDRRLEEFVPLHSDVLAQRWQVSADGESVVYAPDTGVGLWLFRRSNAQRVELVSSPAQVFHPRWSPDGRAVAAQIVRPGEPGFIAILRPPNHEMERVLPVNFAVDNPNWSPDGRRLLVIGCPLQPGATDCAAKMFLVDLATRHLVEVPGSDLLGDPSWSPDGRYIAAHTADQSEMRLFDVARERWTKIVGDGAYGASFWTRDSHFLYYQNRDDRPAQPLFRFSLDDGTVERVTPASPVLPAGVAAFRLNGVTADGDPTVALVRDNSEIYVLDIVLP